MKRITSIIVFMCISIFIYAQETELTIDNQTPGWLSSQMTYSEQVSVKRLTLKGYINKTDMDFVNDLVRTRSLEYLDLYDVILIDQNNVEYNIWNNLLNYGGGDGYGGPKLKKIIFPQIMTNSNGAIILKPGISIDTLGVTCKNNGITYSNARVSYIDIMEGSDTINTGSFSYYEVVSGDWENDTIKIGPFPKSLKVINKSAFMGKVVFCEPFLLPPSIIRLGKSDLEQDTWESLSWFNGYYNSISDNRLPISPQRFDFPDSLVIYNSSCFGSSYSSYYQSKSKDIFESDTITVGENCKMMYAQLKANVGIFYAKTPPSQFASYSGSGIYDFSFGILYVPEGCSTAYKNEYIVGKGNQIGEIREMKSISSISVSPSSNELYVGESLKLNATIYPNDAFDKTFYWESGDENIATIDKSGVVTAVSPGTTTINAISKNGAVLGTCDITVLQHVTGISLNYSEIELNKIGDTYKLEVNVYPDNASNKKIDWLSSNIGVCHVAANGTVTATGFGTAVVFATSEDGDFTASCIVNVIDTSSISESQTNRQDLIVMGKSIHFKGKMLNNTITIYSSTGNLIYQGKTNSISLPSGLYFIKCGTNIFKVKL